MSGRLVQKLNVCTSGLFIVVSFPLCVIGGGTLTYIPFLLPLSVKMYCNGLYYGMVIMSHVPLEVGYMNSAFYNV